ncbi:MAG TPA: hypothetical protein VHC44_19635 [Verrucomicrobiae bacterium]|nr:hypothetical protein [Verrucomicrobiae bacterium]
MASIPSEFEEKEFEGPLYNQLGSGTHLVWSPGQVFEEHVGIDYALMLCDPDLWQYFGSAGPVKGAFLHRYNWDFIWRRRRRRNLPNFRLNLFIQAKRSHYYRHRPRRLMSYLTKGSCWRFDIEDHQQEALERLAEKLGSRAVVCYAAPAFHRVSQLNAHTSRGSILPNSSFPSVSKLVGHKAFYYQVAGGNGVANADPTRIEGASLEEMLQHLAKGHSDTSQNNPRGELKNLGEEVYKMVIEKVSDENPRKALYMESLRHEERFAQGIEGPTEAIVGFLRVLTFSLAFNCEWFVVSHA